MSTGFDQNWKATQGLHRNSVTEWSTEAVFFMWVWEGSVFSQNRDHVSGGEYSQSITPIRPPRVTLDMGREMPQDDAKTSMQASSLSTSFDRKTRCPKISSLSLVNAYYIIGFPGF
ncbi:hypothetical protein B0H13DRAFT_1850802 [Mycena leptocephala]|nr:hypothetical protein B0H13DRAFT_1850802 [Mycena leptocephala]